MSSSTTCLPVSPLASEANSKAWSSLSWGMILLGLSLLTLLIHGYHPLAEDGGLYVAGIEWKLNPTLFPTYTAFVTEHLRFSLFAPTITALVHLTHLPLDWVLLLTDLFSIWFTFYAAHRILRCCVSSELAQLVALALLAAWWTLPVAGTSLMFMDPYLTARSLSTPLSLLAISFALRDDSEDWRTNTKPILLTATSLVLAAAVHPLMAAYAIAIIVLLQALRLKRPASALTLITLSTLVFALVLQLTAPPESPALLAAEITRYYWFLSQWQWFELLGLLGPLAILTLILRTRRDHLTPSALLLCRACIALGLLATLIAVLFAREGLTTHLVARMQPLRAFLLVYAVMTLLLGATLAQLAASLAARAQTRAAQRAFASAPAITMVAMALTMHTVQRQAFTDSLHLELPGRTNTNPWSRAFLWVSDNTPANALFALDARYINTPGEDAQTFRATALRSALPDYSKDGGEASITPALADDWQRAAAAQRDLSLLADPVRDARLRPYAATWIVLHTDAITTHPCPYNNGVVKVCKLTP